MEVLKQRILQEGSVVSNQLLKLDSILNHQVDPSLTMAMGKEFAQRFAGQSITKILTIEASGIPIAFAVAYELQVPLVFARRKKIITTDYELLIERVPSFTKGIVTDIVVSAQYLQPSDKVLFIDDIIANGDAARGIIKIIERAGAELIGVGIVVEKSFQAGGKSIREQGIRVESLVKIASLDHHQIQFE